MIRGVILALVMALAMPAFAVQPDEMLDDPVLEARAREMSGELRCLVCRNESIDESNAELAKDLRLLVRERLVAGDTNAQVMSFIVERYGEYVLLRPTAIGSSLVLWLAGPGMLLLALGIGAGYVRSRRNAPEPGEALSDDEKIRLEALLKD